MIILGTNSKWMTEQKLPEFRSNQSLYEISYLSEKKKLNTPSISKIISVISFSIKIVIEEYSANTMVTLNLEAVNFEVKIRTQFHGPHFAQ